jgi:NgoMIV restriction enzyme
MADFPSFRLADYVLGWTTPEKCGLQAICQDCGSHNVKHGAIHPCTAGRHECNVRGWAEVPNNADVSSRISLDIAKEMLEFLGITKSRPWQPRQSGALLLEHAVMHFTSADDGLMVKRGAHLSEYAQYRHLRGRSDDRLDLDIAVSRQDVLLAVLELKTTIRSDRARGAIRNLTSTLTQHSGSTVPLAAVVTAEPLPGRLAKCAPQTGDRHAVYHVARTALAHAVEATQAATQYAEWQVAREHIRDFTELFPYLRAAAT